MDLFGKQLLKAKKETAASIQELLKETEEEVSQNFEDPVNAFMKTVHMEVSNKLKGLEEQRRRTEERVLNVLERVVASCVPDTL